jgi:hypothetical protein
MDSPTLFDEPRVRLTDPQTSHDAAARVTRIQGKLRAQILDFFNRYNSGFTKTETCRALQIDPEHWPTCASALSQLKNAGYLEWRGTPPTRRAGQNVWFLATRDVPTGDVL